MIPDSHYLDIALLGKEYRVACPPEERESLLRAVSYVDARMHDIAEKTRSNVAERIAVMAALNIAHELLSQPVTSGDGGSSAGGLDIGALKRRIAHMESQLDAVLAVQDALI